MGKDVKQKEETALALGNSFEDMADGGFESADKDAYAIPFLQILQKMSPQVDEAEESYVEGARPGMFFNTVTEDLYDGTRDGVLVIPCHYERVFLEWIPRNDGGGLVAEHQPEDGVKLMQETTRDEYNRDILPNGHELQDTRVHYVLLLHEDGGYEPAVISLSRTGIKPSKKWMSLMQGIKLPRKEGGVFTPPMFSHVYRLRAQIRSNDQGTWYVPHAAKERILGDGDEDLFNAAKGFRDSIQAGKAKVNHDTEANREPGEDDDDIPGF